MVLLQDLPRPEVERTLLRFGLRLVECAPGRPIPGTYWGEPEAGLWGDRLQARHDTPIHSVLHETSHYVCMDSARRGSLFRDAGGGELEECAVCYLQILLSDHLPGMGRERMFRDMDSWGYSFRRGASRLWFEEDSGDARSWLIGEGILDDEANVLWKLRR